jgi:hypothetical protein
MAVVLNGVHNPHRGLIAKEIVDAVLVSRADSNSPAIYHTKVEQERRLRSMFEKWCSVEGVWSLAASKVCHALAHPG